MPNKKDAYYFPHDSNAKDDPKCMLLIEQLNLEGYGIFWVLVEILRDEPSHKYPMKLIPAIARKYNTTAAKVEAVVKGYELFSVDQENFFFSQSLIDRMAIVDAKRRTLSEAGTRGNNKRWNRQSFTASPIDHHPITTRSQVKETKPKKKKGEESITHALNDSIYDHETVLKAIIEDETFINAAAKGLKASTISFKIFCEKKLALMEVSGHSSKYPIGTIKKILIEDYNKQMGQKDNATMYVPPTGNSKKYFNPETKIK